MFRKLVVSLVQDLGRVCCAATHSTFIAIGDGIARVYGLGNVQGKDSYSVTRIRDV
jgi:hypothetical protein